MNHDQYVISCGTKILKQMRKDFAQKRSLEEECRNILSYFYYIDNRGLDGDLSRKRFSREDLQEKLAKSQKELEVLNKKLEAECGCIGDIDKNIPISHENLRMTFFWNRLLKKVAPDIRNFRREMESKYAEQKTNEEEMVK